jgi:dihydroorotase/N-acyl-D-amino-acid deacylase
VGRDNWSKQQIALDRIEQAQAEGIDIGFDCYPYLAGSTVLTQLLPQAALSNGIPGLMEQLVNPKARADFEHFLNTQTAQGWDDIFLSSVTSSANRPLVGRHIAAVAEERGASPAATVLDLIAEERGKVLMISFNQSEANLRTLLQHPLSSIITDGFYVDERPHPRLAGAFPTFLGEFVRERKHLPLPEAIRKITSLPASRLGLKDRGHIAPGAVADITVFDPLTIGSPATFNSPSQPPTGIHLIIKEQLLLPKSPLLLNQEGKLATGKPLAHLHAEPALSAFRYGL